jgi:hypothetical protein
MANINFPNNPSVNDEFLVGGKTYVFDGVKWVASTTLTKTDIELGNVQNYSIADQAEAEAGSVSNKYMTPLRTAQAITALVPDPTIATQAEAETGTDNTVFMTPLRTAQTITALAPDPTIISTNTPPNNPVDGQVWVPRINYQFSGNIERDVWITSIGYNLLFDSMIVDENDYIYIGSSQNLIKVDQRDGSILLNVYVNTLGTQTLSNNAAGLVLSDDKNTLYYGPGDAVYAVDTSDFSVVWSNTTDFVNSGPSVIKRSPDGTELYCLATKAGGPRNIKKLNASNGTLISSSSAFPGSNTLYQMEQSPDGNFLYVFELRYIRKINASDYSQVWETPNPFVNLGLNIFSGAISRDGNFIYAGDGTGIITKYDASNGSPISSSATFGNRPQGIDVSPDGTIVYISMGFQQRGARALNTSDMSTLWSNSTISTNSSFFGIAISSDGYRLYLYEHNGNLIEINPQTGLPTAVLDEGTVIYEKFQNMVYNTSTSEWEGIKTV